MKYISVISGLLLGAALYAQSPAESRSWAKVAANRDKEWLCGDEARSIADNVLFYQDATGGWPKNIQMQLPVDKEEVVRSRANKKEKKYSPTIDNDATSIEMEFLAAMYDATGEKRYKKAFLNGVKYLLDAQYPNGGWPQFYPLKGGYSTHITFNDDAMINVMEMLREMLDPASRFSKMIDKKTRIKIQTAYDKGIQCILDCQIRRNGVPTVWCAQHDEVTLEPAPARAFELASFSGAESCGIVLFLMEIPNPSQPVKDAVEGAVNWFNSHKVEGMRIEMEPAWPGETRPNRVMVADSTADPLWGRFYDLETEKPFVCDRDGVKKEKLSDIGYERRNGYKWFWNGPAHVLKRYEKWKSE